MKYNDDIEFYDSIPSNKSLRFTLNNEFQINPVNINNKDKTDTIRHVFETIVRHNKKSFSVYSSPSLVGNYVHHSFPTDIAGDDYPYLNVWIKINTNAYDLNENSIIDIDITPPVDKHIYEIKEVYPSPTSLSINRVKFIGKDAVETILREGGVYIAAENVELAYHKERMFLVISVLLGTLIAFAIEIIIQLIYKWRRLQPNKYDGIITEPTLSETFPVKLKSNHKKPNKSTYRK